MLWIVRDKKVPVITYIMAAINNCSLTSLSFSISLELNKTKKTTTLKTKVLKTFKLSVHSVTLTVTKILLQRLLPKKRNKWLLRENSPY